MGEGLLSWLCIAIIIWRLHRLLPFDIHVEKIRLFPISASFGSNRVYLFKLPHELPLDLSIKFQSSNKFFQLPKKSSILILLFFVDLP